MTLMPRAMPARNTDASSAPQRLVTVLAFIAGYVDTFGFVALFGLFTSHVTTNFVLIGANLVGQGQGVLLKLSAFPAFIVGVAVAKFVVAFRARRGMSAERAIYVLQALCLCSMMFAGLAALPVHAADSAAVLAAGLFGAAAMGIQNAHSWLVLDGRPLTTTMTQNVTLGVIDAIDAMTSRGADARNAALARLGDRLLPVGGFAVGAVVAAIAYVQASFWALLFPFTLLVILALRAGTEACAVGE